MKWGDQWRDKVEWERPRKWWNTTGDDLPDMTARSHDMAISKRTRFEVLRRDNHTCRYCRSADNPLTVDHVVPVALGGRDDPSNLVAACRDCNAGKSSAAPDAALVADVSDFALRWREAMDIAIQGALVEYGERSEWLSYFEDEWNFRHGRSIGTLPPDWKQSIRAFVAAGLPMELLDEAIDATAARRDISRDRTFRYFAGICWNMIRDIQGTAQRIFEMREERRSNGA